MVELRVRWIWDPWRVARESAGDSELAHSVSVATEGGGREGTEGAEGSAAGGELGKEGVVDLATLDGRKTGIGLHDGNDTATGGFGRRRRHYCDVQHRKKGGGCMTGGVHV